MCQNRPGCAHKYAQLYVNKLLQDQKISDVLNKVDRAIAFVQTHKVFFTLLSSTGLEQIEIIKFIQKLADKLALNQAEEKFITFLAMKKQLLILPAILEALRTRLVKGAGQTACQITSSHPLTKKMQENLLQQVKTYSDKEMNIKFAVDPELILGIKVSLDNQLLEHSLRRKLEQAYVNLMYG